MIFSCKLEMRQFNQSSFILSYPFQSKLLFISFMKTVKEALAVCRSFLDKVVIFFIQSHSLSSVTATSQIVIVCAKFQHCSWYRSGNANQVWPELKKLLRRSESKSWWSSRSWGFVYKRFTFHQLYGNNYGVSQYYATSSKEEIMINQAIFTEHIAWNAFQISFR